MPYGVVVDSNVLLDISTDDPLWGSWSAENLALALDTGPVILHPLVYAEVSIDFLQIEDLEKY